MGVAVNLYLFSRAALARGVAGEGDHHAFAVERNPPVGIERPDVRRMPLAFVLLLFDQFADLFVRHALVGGSRAANGAVHLGRLIGGALYCELDKPRCPVGGCFGYVD